MDEPVVVPADTTLEDPQDTQAAKENKKSFLRKFIFLFTGILFVVIAFFTAAFWTHLYKKAPTPTVYTTLDKNALSGRILFLNGYAFTLFDLKTSSSAAIAQLPKYSTWSFANNAIFVASPSALSKISLDTQIVQ